MESKFIEIATKIGQIVTKKNEAYGDSVNDTAEFLRLLWPKGIPVEAYGDVGLLVRIWDKIKRIANQKEAFSENPYQDMAGYAVLGIAKDTKNKSREAERYDP